MKTWVIALLVVLIFVISGGCSSSAPEVSATLAPAGDAAGSGTRIASALSWGAPTVLESTPAHCTIGKSLATIAGNPAVSYMIHSAEEPNPGFTVYYARANDSAGTSWADPVAVDFWSDRYDYNSVTSLREVNGKPAIAYQVFIYPGGPYTGGEVRYVRAKDPTGKNWGYPVKPGPRDDEGLDWQGLGTRLYVVNGNPAVWYRDAGSRMYVRALDASGSNWGSPLAVSPEGGTFSIVNGYPTSRYSDGGVLYFRRAADANGDSWCDPVIIGNGTAFGSFNIVEGQPAVTYSDSGVLYYCRAADASGDNWGAPVDLCYDNGIGSFAIVNGHPAVTYSDDSGALYFRRAEDATGDTWGEERTVLADADPVSVVQLVDVDGYPAIAFSGPGSDPNSSVRFIRALDAGGAAWPSTPVDVTVSGDASVELLNRVAFINGLPSIFFYSGINTAAPGDPPTYNSTYLNFVQALDSAGSAWEPPETVVDFGFVSTTSWLTISETCVGVYFSDAWHALNFVASEPAPSAPPDPAVNVQLSTDKSGYIIGEDITAVLTAVVTDEYGDPIGGLGTGAFATTLNGGGVVVTFSESATSGTYTGSLAISGLIAGDYLVETTVTDTRAVSGSDSAAFTMYEPGSGGMMHVGDLDADKVLANKNRWCAVFTVKIEDSSGNPVSGADVSFSLSGDDSGYGQAITGGDGTASYQAAWINGNGSVTFTVNDVTLATYTYSPDDNHDPDGDSDGTSITASGP